MSSNAYAAERLSVIGRRQVLIGAAASALVAPSRAASRLAAKTLPASGMRSDLQLLGRAFEALHPGLLRYNGLSAIRARLERLFA